MGAKEDAMKERRPEDKVMYTENFSKYSFCKNYDELMRIIKEKKVPRICEYIFEALPVNFFYDIDIKETANPKEFEDYKKIVHDIINKTTAFFEDRGISVTVIVLKSHTSKKAAEQKKSFHIIFRGEKKVFSIPCCISITNFIFAGTDFMEKGIIDKSVLREGNFRSYLCSKKDEVRPFLRCKSFGSEEFEDVDTFVQHYRENAITLTENDLSIPVNHRKEKGCKPPAKKIKLSSITEVNLKPDKKTIMVNFILNHFKVEASELSLAKEKDNSFTFRLKSKWCPFLHRNHNSNGQYITINVDFTARMCHDPDCKGKKENKILSVNYPEPLKAILGISNIESVAEECRDLVLKAWGDKVEKFEYDASSREFTGRATRAMEKMFSVLPGCCSSPCIVYHKVTSSGFSMECRSCKNEFPMMPMVIPPVYNIGTFVGQIVINNYGTPSAPGIFNLARDIFNDDEITESMNRILSGHIMTTSNFLSKQVKGFVYADDKKPMFYYFNGTIWKEDRGNKKLRAKLMSLDSFLTRILSIYSSLPVTESNKAVLDSCNTQIRKFQDPQYLNKIIEGSGDYYHIPDFTSKLDCNKRLLAFENGVFDLEKNEFRVATMEDNLSFTVGYDYDPDAETEFLWDFLRKILPKPHLLDYMLKRLADCLDGSIPNTIFLIITGDGANGKSQLFNLMEAALGDGYARKIAVTLLTRRRENANDTNSEMIDMKGKRFIFFSEPESGEKFNISCLKDLTGSEKIKATAKYEGASSFNIDAKMFIGCNEIPELKAEDKATWRRVRLLEFKSNFVDEPNPAIQNQYPKDATIPDKIKYDVTWRKALMKILLEYHYRTDIVEPIEVKRQTEALREENNEMEAWCRENIEIDPEFEAKQHISPKIHSHWLTKDEVKRALSLKKDRDVDRVLVPFIRNLKGIKSEYKKHSFLTPSGEKKKELRCWLGIRLKKTIFHTECKLENWFKKKGITVGREMKFTWTLNQATGQHRRYDFLILDHKILVELDGAQHFEEVEKWGKLKDVQQNDECKNKLALQHHYHVVRICQRIVFFDREDWEMKLENTINELKNEKMARLVKIGSVYY